MRTAFFLAGAAVCALPPCVGPRGAAARQIMPATVPAQPYLWRPVRLGAGGFVTGFVTHPLNASVRYCRTDVGNAYRWDAAQNLWLPMKVYNADGSGVPASAASAPSPGGIGSIAVDPSNTNIVFMAFPTPHSADVGGGSNVNIYKSVDGGKNFTAANLNIAGDPNSRWRTYGERLMADPNNGKIVYYGSDSNGLYRSVDGGATFSPVSTGVGPAATSNVIGVRVVKSGGTVSAFGQSVSSVVYALTGEGDVFRSVDGGQTWTNITTGTGLSGHIGVSAVDQNSGALYVAQDGTTSIWRYSGGAWTTLAGANTSYSVFGIAIDPNNSSRIFAAGGDSSVSRTTDGGARWKSLGSLQFANTLGWLPQTTGTSSFRSEAGLYFDKNGTLWLPQGNEGVLKYTPTANNTETSVKFTIDSAGIEEFVAHDVIIPKGGGSRAIVAVEDATGLVVANPDAFTAKQIPLQTQLISNANSVAACPNDSSGLFVSTSDINFTGYPTPGQNFSGASFDGGATWNRFGAAPTFVDSNGKTQSMQTGSIAVSRRSGWGAGADHIVFLPNYSFAPQYSKDGGKTWAQTVSFPLSDAHTLDFSKGYQGYWNLSLKMRMLYADPFVADKFYLKLNAQPASLYVSLDGGVTWSPYSTAGGAAITGLPNYVYHGQLAVNYNLQDDLWFAYGWEGNAGPGLYHHAPGSATFAKLGGISSAITLTLGAGRGGAGDAPYTAYFYGALAADPQWGVFRSTNAGASWERIAYYPTGIYDQPTCMAASWDAFGMVYLGFSGNSFVYGAPSPVVTGHIALEGVSDLSQISPYSPLGTFHLAFRAPGQTVELYGKDVTLAPVAGSAKGAYSLTDVPAGTYDVALKGAKTLRVLLASAVVSAAGAALPDVVLPAGDANADNYCDTSDFGVLVGAYGGSASVSGSGYDARADFNCDGFVDTTDFGLLVGNYGAQGAP